MPIPIEMDAARSAGRARRAVTIRRRIVAGITIEALRRMAIVIAALAGVTMWPAIGMGQTGNAAVYVVPGSNAVLACKSQDDVAKQIRLAGQKDAAAASAHAERTVAAGACRLLQPGTRVQVWMVCAKHFIVRVREVGSPDEWWAFVGDAIGMPEMKRLMDAVFARAKC